MVPTQHQLLKKPRSFLPEGFTKQIELNINTLTAENVNLFVCQDMTILEPVRILSAFVQRTENVCLVKSKPRNGLE